MSVADITLGDLWDDISREINVVKDLIVNLGKDVGGLFTPKTNTDEVFARLNDHLIDAALDTLSNVIDFLLKAISLVIQKFKELGHYKADVPIFSGGRDFTLFNCFSLILAIPTTIVYKIAAGRAPPKLAGQLTKSTLKHFIEGDASLDKSLVTDINEVGGACCNPQLDCFLCDSRSLSLAVLCLFWPYMGPRGPPLARYPS